MASDLRRAAAAGLAFLMHCAVPASAQDIGGIALGEPIPGDLPEPAGSQQRGPFAYTLWDGADGVSMSATTRLDTGEVVYVELWRTDSAGVMDAPLSFATFGETTLGALTDRFGSEGIVFEGPGRSMPAGENAAFFTSYEIAGTDAVMVFVTLMPLAEASAATARASVLDAVILAQGSYLDATWGPNRGTLPGYAPIPDPTD